MCNVHVLTFGIQQEPDWVGCGVHGGARVGGGCTQEVRIGGNNTIPPSGRRFLC